MGQLIDGKWDRTWYEPDAKGRFLRTPTRFHHKVSTDGSTPFAPEAGRYHLYVSWACPWASRVVIGRAMRKLEEVLPLTVVSPKMGDDGWRFGGYRGSGEEPLFGARLLQEIYLRHDPRYTGRVTVPLLWDKQTSAIVNNESKELLRMLSEAFFELGDRSVNLCPPGLKEELDRTLEALYEPVNNGVYRCGFAGSQDAYETACRELFAALDHWEQVLARQRYLLGNQLTEADIALYGTLIRFDLVYYSHFKCNLRRLQDYPNLWGYTRDLYQTPAFGQATDLEHIKVHYYWSQPTVNPSRIVPLGPELSLDAPHDRARLG